MGKKEKVRINMYQNIRLEHKLDELYKKSLLIETFFKKRFKYFKKATSTEWSFFHLYIFSSASSLTVKSAFEALSLKYVS